YDPHVYERSEVERIAACFLTLLDAAVSAPEARVLELALVDPAERRRLVVDLNRTDADVPEACIQTLFEQQALRTPEGTAVVDGRHGLTYAELDRAANRVARRLDECGVARG